MIDRSELYEVLKTILDPDIFSFDDDLEKIGVKVPIRSENVKNLSDFVKSMLKNTCRPTPVGPIDRTVGNGTFKIFGDFVDHDETLTVGIDGRLGVAQNPHKPEDFDAVLSIEETKGGLEVTTKVGDATKTKTIEWPTQKPTECEMSPEIEAKFLKIEEGVAEAKRAVELLRDYVVDQFQVYS